MIIERMEFRLRFGKAKDGIATWKAIMDRCKSIKEAPKMRMLTDLTGPSYTIIVEMEHRSFLEFAPHQHAWLSDEKLRELYQAFIPLCERSERTLYHLEYEV